MSDQPDGLIGAESLKLVRTIDLVNELRSRSPGGFVLVMDNKDPSMRCDWEGHYGEAFDRTLVLIKYAEWDLHAGWARANWYCDPDSCRKGDPS